MLSLFSVGESAAAEAPLHLTVLEGAQETHGAKCLDGLHKPPPTPLPAISTNFTLDLLLFESFLLSSVLYCP